MTNRFLTILFLIFSFSNIADAQEADKNGFLVQVGDSAPEFTAELTDGSSFDLQAQRGKVVMLQFTASWCSVCRKEMPYIEDDIWKKLEDDNFIVIGVDRDETLEVVLSYQQKMKITYPLALDPNAEIFGQYADLKAGVTRNVIIDENGKIIYLSRLFQLDEFYEMRDVIFKAVEKLR
jgi:peroxiredoxin